MYTEKELEKTIKEMTEEVKKDLANKVNGLSNNVEWRLEKIRASHAEAVKPEKGNKFFAYFLRAAEVGVLLCILAKLFS